MKTNLLLIFAAGVFSFVLLTGSSQGRASSAGEGNTGAPGDNNRTCVTCHNTSSTRVALDLAVLDPNGNEVTEYEPDAPYTIRVRVDSISGPAAKAWGFQMVCLDAPSGQNGADVKNWVDTSANNYKIANARGRQYVEHSGPSRTNEFLVDWRAPSTSSGQLTFYAGGNGVNLNGGTTGDGAAVNRLEIKEKISSSIDKPANLVFDVSPNPAIDWVDISLDGSQELSVQMIDLNGRVVRTWPASPVRLSRLDLSDIMPGMYLIEVVGQDQSRGVQRLIVR